MTPDQIIAILMLLQAFGVSAPVLANVSAILHRQTPITTSQPSMTENTTPPAPTSAPEPVSAQPVSQARIEIINPIAGKGIDRQNLSTSASFDERGNPRNEVYIGAIVYGVDGSPISYPTVYVAATDTDQNKAIVGTGTVTPIYVNGQKIPTPYYAFDYLLKTSGTHTVTFSYSPLADGIMVSQQVDFQVGQ